MDQAEKLEFLQEMMLQLELKYIQKKVQPARCKNSTNKKFIDIRSIIIKKHGAVVFQFLSKNPDQQSNRIFLNGGTEPKSKMKI